MNAKSSTRLLDAACLLLIAVMALAAWWVAGHGIAGPVPYHFDLAGHPDKWGDRTQVAWSLAGMGAVAAALLGLSMILERQGDGTGWRSSLRLARGAMAVVFGFTTLLIASLGLGWIDGATGMGHLGVAGLSLLFLVLGAVIGRARPNPLIGVRTFWTLTSRLSWDKSNRLAGRLMAGIGLIGLFASPFVPQAVGMTSLVVAILIAAALSVLESWRVWASDPDRRAGRMPTV